MEIANLLPTTQINVGGGADFAIFLGTGHPDAGAILKIKMLRMVL